MHAAYGCCQVLSFALDIEGLGQLDAVGHSAVRIMLSIEVRLDGSMSMLIALMILYNLLKGIYKLL